MAASDKIIQGGDYEIDFTVTDSAGVAVDLTTLANYIAVLYYADGEVLQQYSRETKAGFKSLTETTPASGIFTVKLQSADTKTARKELVFGEVKVETVDVTYDDSTKHNPDTGIEIGTVVESQTEQYTALT